MAYSGTIQGCDDGLHISRREACAPDAANQHAAHATLDGSEYVGCNCGGPDLYPRGGSAGAESRWLTALVVSIVLVLVGLFQTVLTITVISLVPIVGIRNKAILVAFGIMWAFVAAIFAMIAGSSLIGLYAYMGVYVFVPSGIVFGWLLASKEAAELARR